MSHIKIKFWGVRGSVPSPGLKTAYFGGNTSCLEILSGKDLIICDAGTGIRALGHELFHSAKKRSIRAHILLSHLHWDHYIGLPFFKPLYHSKNHFVILGPNAGRSPFGNTLRNAIKPPYFPIPISAVAAKLTFKTATETQFKIGHVTIKPHFVNHPGGALGYKFTFPSGKTLVHITDNEPDSNKNQSRFIKWMAGADVLIHDAQYTQKSYRAHKGWGHSSFAYPIDLASKAGIGRVVLFHFDPEDDDGHLLRTLSAARDYIRKRKFHTHCSLAREGASVTL